MKSSSVINASSAFVPLPQLPLQVDINHIKEITETGQLLLLTQDEIAAIKAVLKTQKNGRYDKADLRQVGIDIPYNIIKYRQKYYAMYLGIKHNKHLGAGGFGTIKLLQNLDSGEWSVDKILSRHHVYVDTENQFDKAQYHRSKHDIVSFGKQEYKNLRKVGETFGFFGRTSLSKGYQCHILMKYKSGMELFTFSESIFAEKHKLSTYVWLSIAIKLCDVVADLHKKFGIFHHDIKPENFLYDAITKRIRLIDFGLSCAIPPSGSVKEDQVTGTAEFLPPEYLEAEQYSFATEAYAVGLTIADILGLLDEYRLCQADDEKLMSDSKIKEEPIRTAVIDYLGEHLLVADPHRRSTLQQAGLFFQELRKKVSSGESVTYLDVNVYQQSDVGSKEAIIAELLKFDRVVFSNTQHLLIRDNIALQRELMGKGVILSDVMLVSKHISSLERKIPKRKLDVFEVLSDEPVAKKAKVERNHPASSRKFNK